MKLNRIFKWIKLSRSKSNEYFAYKLNELLINGSIKKYLYISNFIEKYYRYDPLYENNLKFKLTPEIKLLCKRAKMLHYKYHSDWLDKIISSSII